MSTPTLDEDPWADAGGYYSAPPPPGYDAPPPPVSRGPAAAEMKPRRPWWLAATGFVVLAVLEGFFGTPGQDLANQILDRLQDTSQPEGPNVPVSLTLGPSGLVQIDVVGKNPNAISPLDLTVSGDGPLETCDGCQPGDAGNYQVQPGHEADVCRDCEGRERRVLRTREPGTVLDLVLYDRNTGERFPASTSAHARVERISDTQYTIRFEDGGGGAPYVPDWNYTDLVVNVNVLG